MTSSFRRIYSRSICIAMVAIFCFGTTLSCDKSEEKKEVESKISALPVVSSVKILPERPLSGSHLQAVVKSQGFNPIEYIYCWKKNGEEIVGEEESTLESENFVKGDSIEVEVTPYLNDVKGKAKKSEPVIILNSPSVVRSASIEPVPAHSGDDLKAKVDVFDADGDYIRYAYQWKKGDEEILGETDSTLSSTHFKRGDKISYRLSVSDGESEEVVVHSNVVCILNSSPSITSRPSGNIEGFLYEYTVAAEDPDGDQLEFKLSSAPEGMTIDSSTGVIRWIAREKQREGSYEFKVIVSDPEGAMAIQPITLNMSSGVDS